jgi:transposase
LNALKIPELPGEAIRELDKLYHTTRDVRLRTRAQIILLAAEKGLLAAEIAEIVRTDEQTVRRWLKRYLTTGLSGLADSTRPGGPRKVTESYLAQLVDAARQRPAMLALPYSLWTTERLADYMAQKTGIRVHPETVRLHLKAAGIVLDPYGIPAANPHSKPRSALEHV